MAVSQHIIYSPVCSDFASCTHGKRKKPDSLPKCSLNVRDLALNVNFLYSSLGLLSSLDYFTDMFSVKGTVRYLILTIIQEWASAIYLGIQFWLVFVVDLLSMIFRKFFYCLVTSGEKSAGRLNSIHHVTHCVVETVK